MSAYRVIVLMMLSFLAGAASHFYWNAHQMVEGAKKAAVQDAAAMAQLDSAIDEVSGEAQTQTSTLPDLEPAQDENERAVELKRITDYLSVNNSDVIDSKAFESKEACDAAVRKVAGEYSRRGIPATDMVETSPFPDSTGVVVMLRNDNLLYYAGCITNDSMDWAAYVHFKPRGKQ